MSLQLRNLSGENRISSCLATACAALALFLGTGCPGTSGGNSDGLTLGEVQQLIQDTLDQAEIVACWDLDGDGVKDPNEDVNGDGTFDARDCTGEDGATGSPGQPGQPGDAGDPGLACWDLDGDGTADPAEDVNGDGTFDARDCQGETLDVTIGTGLALDAGTLELDTDFTDATYWRLGGNPATATQMLGTLGSAAVEIIVNSVRALSIEPDAISPNLIGGYFENRAEGDVYGAFIGGGGAAPDGPVDQLNAVNGYWGSIVGGVGNRVGIEGFDPGDASYAAIGGGYFNLAVTDFTVIAGGERNTADGNAAAIGGGTFNNALAPVAVVAGGTENTASGESAAVGGGTRCGASGNYSAVAGGFENLARGDFSFAGGNRAKIGETHHGTFLFADSSAFDFDSAAGDEFAARATGGVRFVSEIDGTGQPTAGVLLPAGESAWQVLSDREAKRDFGPIDTTSLLRRLAGIPIQTWRYRAQHGDYLHIGPMAQDFHAAFGVGPDERHISTVDADGVALAAIQGLYQLTQEKDARIEELSRQAAAQQDEIQALTERLTRLEQALNR